ncbi:MAG: HPr family phosphocarrier protein [Lachnospiraceae bacterium]|nr:HPr family phosphocarrier protein [Candidatus Darwinimomas equi]
MLSKEIIVSYVPDSDVSVAALVVQRAGKFRSSIRIGFGTRQVNAKSIMGVMTIPLEKGQSLVVTADGEDAEEAIADLERFLTQ